MVILCDVPTFGYRPRDIRNGLAMPPKMMFSTNAVMCVHTHHLLTNEFEPSGAHGNLEIPSFRFKTTFAFFCSVEEIKTL